MMSWDWYIPVFTDREQRNIKNITEHAQRLFQGIATAGFEEVDFGGKWEEPTIVKDIENRPIKRYCLDKYENIEEKPEISDPEREWVDVVLGKYNAEKNQITLYMKNISECYGVADRDIFVEVVLAHELFHAMHYMYSGNHIRNSWNTGSEDTIMRQKGVKESLADYFAFVYIKEEYSQIDELYRWAGCGNCIEQNKKRECLRECYVVEEELLKKWNRHPFPHYPYSGAKAFLFAMNDLDRINPSIEMMYQKDAKNGYYTFLAGKLYANVLAASLKRWSKEYEVIKKSLDKGYEAAEAYFMKSHLYYNPEGYLIEKYYLEFREHFGDWYMIRDNLNALLGAIERFSGEKPYIERFPYIHFTNIRRFAVAFDNYSRDKHLTAEDKHYIMEDFYAGRSHMALFD